MIAVGIDPGLKGAVVAVGEDEKLLGWWDAPTLKVRKGKTTREELVPSLMRDVLCEVPGGATIFVEVQQARPKQGRSSTLKTGFGYGLWLGLVVGQGCFRHELVQPQAWQRSMLAGRSGDTKARSLQAASALFPGLPLTKPRGRVPCMDGRSDAALIALWGLRRMRGGE